MKAAGISSMAELSRKANIRPNTLTNWRAGRTSSPRKNDMAAVAAALGVQSGWLETGEGEEGPVQTGKSGRYLRNRALHNQGVHEQIVRYREDGDLVHLPIYEPKPSAGRGNHVHLEAAAGDLAFSKTYLRELGVVPQAGCLLQVDGDSMEPALRNGELVLVDRGAAAKPFATGIWVFSIRDALSIKRVQALPSGQFRILSDNPAYEPYTVDPEVDPFKLIGRVVWAGRRF